MPAPVLRESAVLRPLLIFLLLVPLLVLGGLALQRQHARADFVLASTEPRTLDPHRASWLAEIQLSATLFEGLTRLNRDTLRPEPAVAERWTVAGTPATYTFYLRPTARWSTGEPVTSADFVAAWLRVLDPRAEAQYANLLFVIRGAAEYYRSRLNDNPADDLPAAAVGIAAPEPGVLTVALAGPCPYFLDLTSFITFAPAHRPTLEYWAYRDGQVLRNTQHLWTRPGNIVCNGPFRLTAWEFKRSIRCARNPEYWDAAAIALDTLEAWITSDQNAALIAYRTGRVDLVRWLDRPVAEALLREVRAGRRSDFHAGARFATFFYRVNCRRPPLDNPELRRALSLGIDRRALVEHVLRLEETPAFTLVPPAGIPQMVRTAPDGTPVYYAPPAGLGAGLDDSARVAAARAALARSGFADQAAGRPIEIAFPPDAEQRTLAEAIQVMWEQTLGIRVELRIVEGKVLSTRIRNLDYDLARSDWYGDYLDPSTFLELFASDSGQNRTGWSSAEYDALLTAAARETDDARRFALCSAAERLLCEDALPIIPVFYRRGNYLLNPALSGLQDNLRDVLLLQYVHRQNGAAGNQGGFR